MKKIGMCLLLSLASAACTKTSGGSASSSDKDPLTQARAAIVAHNYGDAAKSAHDAISAAPHDPQAQLELARAEALLGNQGNALSALEQAVTDGLANPATAFADPAFDDLRATPRFAALQQRALPGGTGDRAPALQAGQGNDAVSISGPPGHEVIKAGDVSIGG